eukprot:8324452-Pyramimonas_sp.AAC.1
MGSHAEGPDGRVDHSRGQRKGRWVPLRVLLRQGCPPTLCHLPGCPPPCPLAAAHPASPAQAEIAG